MSSGPRPKTAQVGRWGGRVTGGGPTWLRVAVIATVLVVAFVAAQTCQKSQIRVDKDQAIATAKQRIEFTPERTQIRLLRQGITSKPYWIVSLSIPTQQKDVFRELALVKIDANTGKVDSVKIQR
jgi:hypothetical protein